MEAVEDVLLLKHIEVCEEAYAISLKYAAELLKYINTNGERGYPCGKHRTIEVGRFENSELNTVFAAVIECNNRCLIYQITARKLYNYSGIPVNFNISTNQMINLPFMGENYKEKTDEDKCIAVATYIAFIKELHKNLIFSKKHEAFNDKRYNNPNNILTNYEDIIFGCTYEKCCVCDDETVRETDCGHTICVMCWNKLKKKCCPICRENIKKFKTDGYNSDSDDNSD